MSEITIIAGPPGVGKSTMGHLYVSLGTDIIKKDEMIQASKIFHSKIFEQIAIQNWLNAINSNLECNKDFAVELTLGMQRHYDFVIAQKKKSSLHRLNVVLFFTDDLQMCKARADKRHKSGQHEVNPQVLEDMYHNTIPLLEYYFNEIDKVLFINASSNDKFHPIAKYSPYAGLTIFENVEANWFLREVKPFIDTHLQTQQPASFSR